MAPKRPLSRQTVERMREREANAGLDAGDAAAQWLEANDPPAAPALPKSIAKNKTLHQWRRRGR